MCAQNATLIETTKQNSGPYETQIQTTPTTTTATTPTTFVYTSVLRTTMHHPTRAASSFLFHPFPPWKVGSQAAASP